MIARTDRFHVARIHHADEALVLVAIGTRHDENDLHTVACKTARHTVAGRTQPAGDMGRKLPTEHQHSHLYSIFYSNNYIFPCTLIRRSQHRIQGVLIRGPKPCPPCTLPLNPLLGGNLGHCAPEKVHSKYIITFHFVTYSTSRNTGRPSRQPPPRPARADRKISDTLRGGKFFSFASFSAFSEDPATTRVPGDDASVRSFHGSSTPPRRSTPATRRPKAHAEDRRRIAR